MAATSEPFATAFLLVVLGVLVGVSALFSRASRHFGLPVALLFLVIGMAAGAEGIGGLQFQDYGFAFRVGTVALVLILFDGGLSTPVQAFRGGLGPASVLATVGVVGTAALAGVKEGVVTGPEGYPLEDLEAMKELDLDILDIGRQIVDAPLLDMRLELVDARRPG